MPKNQDNIDKQASGLNAKKYTLETLTNCDLLQSIEKGENLSKNNVEKAICDLRVKLKENQDVLLLITSTNSFRDDRLDTANTRMRRSKKVYAERGQKVICIVTSNCANERTPGDDSKLLNGYNFENRDEIGLDILVRTDDLVEVLKSMSEVEKKNDVNEMIVAALDLIKTKNY